jgi:hypothetical protein
MVRTELLEGKETSVPAQLGLLIRLLFGKQLEGKYARVRKSDSTCLAWPLAADGATHLRECH